MLATCKVQGRETTDSPPFGLVQALRDVDSEGRTSLALAAHFKHEDLVTSLLECRAEANAADAKGNTPLILATARGERHAVEQLLVARANVALQNAEGHTAIDLAVGSELRSVLQAQADRDIVEKKIRGSSSLPSLAKPSGSGNSSMVPKPKSCRLRLDGLPARHPPDHLEELLLDILEEYDIPYPQKVDVAVDPITLKPSGHAYISFALDAQAKDAECTLRTESNLRVSLETVF